MADAAASKRYRERKKAQGQCTRCGKKNDRTGSCCKSCCIKLKARTRRLGAQGLCVDCGKNKVFLHFVRCDPCMRKKTAWFRAHYQKNLAKFRQKGKAERDKRKNEHRCVMCGRPLDLDEHGADVGHVNCVNCRCGLTLHMGFDLNRSKMTSLAQKEAWKRRKANEANHKKVTCGP